MDYFPASLSLPSGAAASTAYFMPVRFRPTYVDYKEQNVGVQLAYNHRGLFSAALRGVYAHYTTTATDPLASYLHGFGSRGAEHGALTLASVVAMSSPQH